MNIKFPLKSTQRYYDIHYMYILNIFRYNKINIINISEGEENSLYFNCYIDDKKVIFDFSDSGNAILENKDDSIIFKFHYRPEHITIKNCYPFTPVSFYDWDQFYRLRNVQNYNPMINNTILCNQKPYGNAVERRSNVQKFLSSKFQGRIDTFITDQLSYWKKVNTNLIHVFIPGFSNNILDRGNIQYMAFGNCGISPNIPEILSYGKKLIPMEHYIQCDDNYMDLEDKIKWVESNKSKCKEIGDNAKHLFEDVGTPVNVIKWINHVLG